MNDLLMNIDTKEDLSQEFLENVKQYLEANNFNYTVSLESQILHDYLVFKQNKSVVKKIKIDSIEIEKAKGVFHEEDSGLKIDPYSQTEQWLNQFNLYILTFEKQKNK